MNTTSISMAKAPADNFITAWITTSGVDLLMKQAGEEFRVRGIAYSELAGDLKSASGKSVPVTIAFDVNDDVLLVEIPGVGNLELVQQPKGHFFSWLRPLERAEPMSFANARRLAQATQNARAVNKTTAKVAEAINDDLPF